MNTFFQLIIKFFLRLFGQGNSNNSKPGTSIPTPGPKPTSPTELAEEAPKPTKPVDGTPVQPTPAEAGPLMPAHGLQFNELFDDAEPSANKLNAILISDGEMEGKFKYYQNRKWAGWYTAGERPIGNFIRAEGELLRELNMTSSSQNLLQAVSDNEGNLEAINAYDGAFLSFGIFQWTLGTGDRVGELPALLKKIKESYPDTFQRYFGRYGLAIHPDTNKLTGYLTLNGEAINTRALKDQFRSREWVYRFWRAGLDPKVQAIEVEHALSRLKAFYWSYKVHGFSLNQIITSEYGVALLLDNHVNLPILVKKALQAAMNETGLKDPTNWDTPEERRVLEAYIRHRGATIDGYGPMYDAKKRAERTARYLKEKVISDERGSFQYSQTRSRSLENHVPQPQGFDPADYPELEPDTEGRDLEFLSSGPAT